MTQPIEELFPDLTRGMTSSWHHASLRERIGALEMVFSDRFGLALGWRKLERAWCPDDARRVELLEWSLRHGRPHIALWPIATPLVDASLLEFWRELEWRENPATPIELVCPELMDCPPARGHWVTLDTPAKLRRLRMVFYTQFKGWYRLGTNAHLTPGQQIERLEWSLRYETLHPELEAYTLAVLPDQVPERVQGRKPNAAPRTRRNVVMLRFVREL